MMIGLVYYEDDPAKAIFRKVYPQFDDGELDDPQWTTLGCDPARVAVMIRVDAGSEAALSEMTGVP